MKASRLIAVALTATLALSAAPAHALSSSGNNSPSQSPIVNTEPSTPPALSDYESTLLDLTNQYRADHGVGPVATDAVLIENSRLWSQEMAATRAFEHSNQWNVAENIAWHDDTNVSPETITRMWMNSPGHRANILNPDYHKVGFGRAVADDGTVYVTQQLIW
ncbi:CAP domain-containing protein [Corynebacterium sp. A21]|uniref:CAP domain-containing protein n=1 Tax=Corynebacterium sp. A21 TaxID=3457318 RepID=UPI003FD3E12A